MTIRIEGLRFEAIIGILPHERRTPQRIHIDARFTYTYTGGRFLDYAAVAETIVSTVTKGRFGLVEEAIEALFETLKEKFPPIETANILFCKPDILPDCRVCVEDFRNFL
ncbi:dihydroneopterin aldolase [Hydrogenimonas sp. SS33]|uniref:dihydroneopterin aldolase n=1 Tax=Hydrogenimonas leucolamina TaxID=2954236 RepID=UPI00336BFE5E